MDPSIENCQAPETPQNAGSNTLAWHLRHQLTIRDACQKMIARKYPGFTPRDNFELYTLGASNYQGPQSNLEAWLRSVHGATLHRCFRGDLDRLNSTYASMLSQSLDGSLGVSDHKCSRMGLVFSSNCQLKPAPEEKHGVIFHNIPNSKYVIRLWPASPSLQVHCLDFMDTETSQPVNLPSSFELWTVLTNNSTTIEYQRLYSMENTHGQYDEAIAAGEEKFVVRDGMQYALFRSGTEAFRFKVPSTI